MMTAPESILTLLSVSPSRNDLISHLDLLYKEYLDFYQSLPTSHESAGIAIICTSIKTWKAVAEGSRFIQPSQKNLEDIYTFLSKLKADPLKDPEYLRGRGFG